MTSVQTKRVCSQGEMSSLPTHRLGMGPVSTLPAWLVETDRTSCLTALGLVPQDGF